ncbi:MAG: hypothetical protein JXR07_16150 [Reichenbachiella sp.]
MSKGIVFCQDKLKIPFKKIEENHFLKAPTLKWTINESLIQELIDLKKEKSIRSKYGDLALTIFFIFMMILFGISIA